MASFEHQDLILLEGRVYTWTLHFYQPIHFLPFSLSCSEFSCYLQLKMLCLYVRWIHFSHFPAWNPLSPFLLLIYDYLPKLSAQLALFPNSLRLSMHSVVSTVCDPHESDPDCHICVSTLDLIPCITHFHMGVIYMVTHSQLKSICYS